MAKDYSYYFSQLRRIEDHREKQAEKEIKKLYKSLMKETRQYIAEEYYQLAEDGKLTFEILRSKGQDARFLQEVEERLGDLSIDVSREIKRVVEETYQLSFDGLKDAVTKSKDVEEFRELLQIPDKNTAQMMWATVDNTIMDVALEKNHKDNIWNIKREIATALSTGDRFETMAQRLVKHLNGNYKKAILITRTEVGRVREAGHLAAAKDINEKLKQGNSGLRMVKEWKSMKDQRVRDQHQSMHNKVVEMDEDFTLPDGTKTQAPKQSGKAKHDCNCRCTALFPLMDDEEFFEATGKHFSEDAIEKAENGAYNVGGIDAGNGEAAGQTPTDTFSRKTSLTEPDEDLKLVNPNYDPKDYKWSNNCQRCVSTYEMRRRGFDVTAKPIPGKTDDDYLAQYFENAWENADRKWCMKGSGKKQVEEHMAAWGDGARAVVGVGFDAQSGHVFIAEQRNGKTYFIDPQTGSENCSDYFKRAVKGRTHVTRVDNLTPSEHIVDCCEDRK